MKISRTSGWLVVLSLSACAQVKPGQATIAGAPATIRNGPGTVRFSCSNYGEVFARMGYPRDAIERGVEGGHVVVRFTVDDSRIAIVKITASDPAFEAAVTTAVKSLACRTERATTFEVPVTFRRDTPGA